MSDAGNILRQTGECSVFDGSNELTLGAGLALGGTIRVPMTNDLQLELVQSVSAG